MNYSESERCKPLLAGVDEAGRGPLAGPVVASAVILGGNFNCEGLDDSKKLGEKARAKLDTQIRKHAISWSIGMATVIEIDGLNIHNATLLAMRRAILGLTVWPSSVLVDGKFIPSLSIPAYAKIGGDSLFPVISAASIIAKQARDRLLRRYDETYPGYRFSQHKGYPTKLHLEALNKLGITPIHRRSYAPVRKVLEAVDG